MNNLFWKNPFEKGFFKYTFAKQNFNSNLVGIGSIYVKDRLKKFQKIHFREIHCKKKFVWEKIENGLCGAKNMKNMVQEKTQIQIELKNKKIMQKNLLEKSNFQKSL